MLTDAHSWRIVGHHVHASLHTDGCLQALAHAVRGAVPAAAGCFHHSDRGRQYCSDAYQRALPVAALLDDRRLRLLPKRVGRTGQRHLKNEFLFMLPDDLAQVRLLVDQAVHLYNEEHPHLTLNYLTPNQVHQQGKSPAGKSERGPCLIPVNI